ncbi:MAG: Flp family type IVb pilin [Firmicutes bacterium]|nr:Flp family type IVb pilin [Bacillota bacterium]
MVELIRRFVREEEGQGMVEYGLILALVAIAAIAILGTLGSTLGDEDEGIFARVVNALRGEGE